MPNRNYASAVGPAGSLSVVSSQESDELRRRAARYQLLAETLLDPRVIAVVRACAYELEREAMFIEAEDEALGLIQPNQAPR